MTLSANEFYEASNLTMNPFRSNPTYAADPRAEIWVGYQKQKEQLVKFLTRARSDQVGNSNFIMLYGGYGTGKSHALLWAQNKILHSSKEEFDSVCYFIPTLKKDKGILTFAGAFTDDLIAKSNLLADVQAFNIFLATSIVRYRDDNNLPTATKEDDIIELLFPAVELSNLAKDINKREQIAEFSNLLSPKGLSDYQAVTLFTRLMNLFTYEMPLTTENTRFKKASYLFIDEVDDLLRSPVKEVRATNDVLRHIYDGCPNCFCLIIGLSAEVAELPAIFEDYILSRIQRQIELHLLDKSDAVEFVKEVLDASRISSKKGENGFFPFEREAVDALMSQIVEITPRKVVNTMLQVIEEVRLSGHNPKDGLISLATLDNADVMEEVLGEGGMT